MDSANSDKAVIFIDSLCNTGDSTQIQNQIDGQIRFCK